MFTSLHAKTDKLPIYLTTSKDGGVLFDPNQDRLLKLNLVGADMWLRLINGKTVSQIAEEIARECGIDQHQVATDLDQLVSSAAEQGFSPSETRLAELKQAANSESVLPTFPWYSQDPTV